jgi:hypothetical protein
MGGQARAMTHLDFLVLINDLGVSRRLGVLTVRRHWIGA